MSLKDDIEAIRVYLNVPWCKLTKPQEVLAEAKQALSRIEDALAVDDGPPQEGDAVILVDCPWKGYNLIAEYKIEQQFHTIITLMRAAEVERRIKEAVK